MKNRYETYLISIALILLAAIIALDAFHTPELSPAVVSKFAGVSKSAETLDFDDLTEDDKGGSQAGSNESGSNNKSPDKKAVYARPININTAPMEALISLKGIGESKASAIIDYRTQNGYFSSVDELINVRGIGEKILANIRSEITV
jgi:competence protein ComEA